ncbi:hypothetical protein SeMB42_g02126 [Synchytrium endobioticum]|uniref:SET domain-containing protein n=1 Tax=Synchytrium endobioticum TaxID=286115 RepID=A0A507DGR0_9FUNG|nr:hypothetical protein SeMB42_g02126 [Synchytrium endobioticum]
MPIAEQHELSASPYPTRVEKVSYGHALVASRNLEAGTIVEKFVGPDVMYETLSDVDKTYVLNYQPMGCSEWKWLLPQSNARYTNHSCDPNSIITNDQHLKTIKPVKEGEQITFVYNVGSDEDWWDPLWSFKWLFRFSYYNQSYKRRAPCLPQNCACWATLTMNQKNSRPTPSTGAWPPDLLRKPYGKLSKHSHQSS